MKLSRFLPIFCLAFAVSAMAQTLTGTITNGTTGKPAAGVEVTLMDLSQGMNEAGTTKSDGKGNFSFKLQAAGAPHLVRATHQGATYFKMVPPGTSSADVQVYDAAKKVDGLSYTVDVMKVQTQGDELGITRLFAVNNQSSPAKTQAGDSTLEFYVPDGAVIDNSMAKSPNGQPVNAPVTQKNKNTYAFSFPLRPGETQLQVGYHIPYSGSATLDPKSPYALQHLVVMLPKSMKFEAQNAGLFQTMQDGPGVGAASVQVAQQTQPGQSLAFKVSGSGTLPAESEGGGASSGQASGGMGGGRPGGGLGAPIDAPDPLQSFRWYILGAFVLILAGGACFIWQRNKTAEAVGGGSMPVPVRQPSARPDVGPQASVPAAGSGMLLQALKEELFQLEVDRQQGHVSKEEYDKHKAALDQTLSRAMQRQSKS